MLLNLSSRYTLYRKTQHVMEFFSFSSELVVQDQYSSCMQENKSWYWEQKQKQQFIIFPTRTILHPYLDIMVVKYFHDNPRSFFNRNKARQD